MENNDQLPSTPPKLVQNYSEYEESNKDRHYSCSPLVLKQTVHYTNTNNNICDDNNPHPECKNIDCEFQSSFILDDINEKLSTTQNTPTDELLYSKLIINENHTKHAIVHSQYNHTRHGDDNDYDDDEQQHQRNKAQSLYSSDETTGSLTSLHVTCCREQGSIFCCNEFEQRIFLWVEDNVPKMVKPEEKMEIFFENKRNKLIRSMSISLKQAEQQTETAAIDLSITSSTSSIPPNSINNNSSISKISSTPAAFEQQSCTQSMKIIEGIEKFGSNLLKRRQSQATSTMPTRMIGGKRLSIMTITQQFNKSDEKN